MPCVPAPPPSDASSSARFNPSHAQYACCFQHLHVQSASTLIALFHLALALTVLVFIGRSFSRPDTSVVEAVFEALVASGVVIVSLALILGLRLESRRLISLYLGAQVVGIIAIFVLFLLLILGYKNAIFGDDPTTTGKYTTTEEELYIVMEIFASLAWASLEVWFLTVVLKSHRYLHDKYNFTGMDRMDSV